LRGLAEEQSSNPLASPQLCCTSTQTFIRTLRVFRCFYLFSDRL
jgi:hypothetical protein